MQPKPNERKSPELFDFKQKRGGEMGAGPAPGATRDHGRFWVSLFVLAASFALMNRAPAHAQEASACTPAIARIVSLQGEVEVQRGGAGAWSSVRQLDTAICAGDRVRAGSLSRAVLFVQPETLVRLDQNTKITLRRSAEEIHVEFHTDECTAEARDARSCGAGYFITRFPKKFKVTTPHMNAAVEGTEFMVESSHDASKLTVLEGTVSSESTVSGDSQLVSALQSLATGAAGAGAITAIVRPEDAVQWALRYPPISDKSDSSGTSAAENLLRAGGVDAALAEIDSVLRGNPGDSDAHSLRSVIQVAKNDKAASMESAQAATTADPANHRGWLALSYAQQASFELEQALESAKKAQSLNPDSSLIHARVAELLLSLGDPQQAEDAARTAVLTNPAESAAHTILGFVHLAAIKIELSRANFSTAIEQDSFNALPRFGLGLAMIRDGELSRGREQLEIAVALDPANSLLRSYVGKAYYEENTRERDALAAQQFELAKRLDPLDPTPHFYDAILKFSQSRPADALVDLEHSAELNNSRAVYRSRQLLDLDLAARNSSQATIYNELGLHQLGLNSATQSLATDFGSGSAHRFLADIYATKPRHDTSRASELLQAQLRQPLGAPPLQPQLANDLLFKSAFFGPATVGLNEFNPLFIRDDVQFQLFGLAGNRDTYGDQAIVTGLHGPFSFGLSQLATDTDGFRPNNDANIRQYDGIAQVQIGAYTSLQVEITDNAIESGDLQSSFDPSVFFPTARTDTDLEMQRFGLRQVVDASSEILVSAIRQDFRETLSFPDPDFPFSITDALDSWKVETQYVTTRAGTSIVIGASYFDGKSRIEIDDGFDPFEQSTEPRHLNAYGYVRLPGASGWPLIQVGLAYDDLKSFSLDLSEFSPKFGVFWQATRRLAFRAAGFRVLKRQMFSDQGLEPTQLAGFNQFYDDTNGSVSDGGGIAADFVFSEALTGGIQISRRDLSAPYVQVDGSVNIREQREDMASGYVYWQSGGALSVGFEPRYHDFGLGAAFDSMELTELPLSVRCVFPSGIRFGLTATAVEQEGEFDALGTIIRGSDSFWLLDAAIAYRLPRRFGTISVEGRNLLGEEFRFQEIDLGVPPRYVPEAQILFRFSVSF